MTVNGERRHGVVEARKTLADYLREDCGSPARTSAASTACAARAPSCSTATRCDRASCSRCRPTAPRSPPSRAWAPDGTLSPVQDAFRQAHGLQCGFCTPGFVVSVHRVPGGQPEPDGDEIREALSGNLCRCTGYQGIIKAVQIAAETMSAQGA
jgi:carbon-monoxide dehydrogenase small subunit